MDTKLLLHIVLTEKRTCEYKDVEAGAARARSNAENYRAMVSGMVELCQDASPPNNCQTLQNLFITLGAFVENGDPTTYAQLVDQVFIISEVYSPWRTVFQPPVNVEDLIQAGQVNRIRGGKTPKTTRRFNLGSKQALELIYGIAQNITAAAGGNPFKEYVFVLDGDSATSSSIFSYTCSHLWKNSDTTGVSRKVALVGYGVPVNPTICCFLRPPPSEEIFALKHL